MRIHDTFNISEQLFTQNGESLEELVDLYGSEVESDPFYKRFKLEYPERKGVRKAKAEIILREIGTDEYFLDAFLEPFGESGQIIFGTDSNTYRFWVEFSHDKTRVKKFEFHANFGRFMGHSFGTIDSRFYDCGILAPALHINPAKIRLGKETYDIPIAGARSRATLTQNPLDVANFYSEYPDPENRLDIRKGEKEGYHRIEGLIKSKDGIAGKYHFEIPIQISQQQAVVIASKIREGRDYHSLLSEVMLGPYISLNQ